MKQIGMDICLMYIENEKQDIVMVNTLFSFITEEELYRCCRIQFQTKL